MTSGRIPWDSPSRFGQVGLVGRKILKRVMRPVTVRVEAEHAILAQQLAELHAGVAELPADVSSANAELGELRLKVEGITNRLDRTERDLERTRGYAHAVDLLVDRRLVSDLPENARQTRVRTGGNRTICSMATGRYRRLLGRSSISFERYAERWGWNLVLSTEDLADGRPQPWGKIQLLRQLLDEYEWVLWLDADVVIVDTEADILEEVRDGKDLYLVEHRWDGPGPWSPEYTANSGVMLIRSCPWSRDFLDRVWQLSDRFREHRWWENAAILALLGYQLEPARLVEPTTWLQRVRFLDVRWNSIEAHRADPPVFVHRGFYDVDTRSRQITADLACVLDGAAPLTAGWDRPARRITTLDEVRRREELPLLFNELGLGGVGAEIGVRKGHFSERLLDQWKGQCLISIDPWLAAPADEYVDISNVTQDEHDVNFAETARRLARFGDRSRIWRTDGRRAAASLQADSLDFVYLDARHDQASVTEDLETWWPFVRPGGVLCGHDYLDGDIPAGVFGVRRAVDAFFGDRGLPVHATTDDAPWPSWMVAKPGGRPAASSISQADVPRAYSRPGDVTTWDEALARLADQPSFSVVQIGAFTGDTYNDPLFQFLSEQLPRHPDAVAVLVEPVPSYFDRLQQAYSGVSGVRFENVAIAETSGERDFFRIAVDPVAHGHVDWLAQVGSLREDRMTRLWERYEEQYFAEQGVEQDHAAFWHANRIVERVSCLTLAQLLQRHELSQLDLLQIDAEGYDHIILGTLDFAHVRPRYINYERVLLQDDEPACRKMLIDAGYALFDWGQNTLAVALD